MAIIQYDKLIRDGMLAVYKNDGVKANVREVTGTEKLRYLGAKLLEEAGEYLKAGDVKELADILEVVEAIGYIHGYDRASLQRIALKKYLERGGFDGGTVLESIEVGRLP